MVRSRMAIQLKCRGIVPRFLIARGNAKKSGKPSDESFDFESATGIKPGVEVVE